MDADDNVVVTSGFRQGTGSNVITLANGNVITRIQPGKSFTSAPTEIPIASGTPDELTVHLLIDDVYYHHGKDDEVHMDGLIGEFPIVLLDTSYYGEITGVNPAAMANQVSLSIEEQQWLAEHTTIITGVDADFTPYEWVAADGVHKGIVADYLRIIEGKLHIRFRPYSGAGWSDVLDRARTKGVDILAAASRTSQREEILSFSNVYITMPGVIISTQDYTSLSELKEKK